MQALRLVDGLVSLAEIRPPTLDDRVMEKRPAAIVRVTTAGVCNTDLELVRGYMDFNGTLGHEFVGVVEAADDPAWIGRRVCGDINAACTSCAVCEAGRPHHCPVRSVLGIMNHDGAFAERLRLPIANLYEVPEHVTDDAAVFTEPLAAGFEILEQVAIGSSDRVLVMGDGKLGLLCGLALSTSGCALTVSGKHDHKLAIAKGYGATTERVDGLRDLPGGFDVVIEATGRAEGLAGALDRVRPGGTIVLKTTVAEPRGVDTNRLVIDEITIVGSRCGPFARALTALGDGLDPRPLILERFPLSRGVDAIAKASERGALKVLIDVQK